jgi:serine/threonine protein kinase
MDRLGEYLVRRVLGEGGMGRVYEAEERLSGRRVALKVLRPELARSERGRRLFLNEMEILARLEHPAIVRSLASVEADGHLALALELVDGKTLRDVLDERGPLPAGEAIEVVAAVCRALVAAHGHRPAVVHRDLKPDNIMVTSAGAVKVMDFGIAKLLSRLDLTNTQNVGTLHYMSPEQIDARSIGPRSDLYSLGVVLYELLSGDPPFASRSPRELCNRQCAAPVPPLPAEVRLALPAAVEELLMALLQKNPDDRPASAEEVLRRLAPYAGGGVAAVPDGGAPSSSGHVPTWHASDARAAWVAMFPCETAPRALPATDPMAPAIPAAAPPQRRPRELSSAAALAIILGFTVVAGVAMYAYRAAAAERADG